MSDSVQKKLAAIMFTNLVEYDEYLKKDEPLALKVLSEHKEILEDNINSFNGNVIKYLESIIKEISQRTWNIKNAIEWHKFTNPEH